MPRRSRGSVARMFRLCEHLRPAVAASGTAYVDRLDRQIEDVMAHTRYVIASDAFLTRNLELLGGITGFGNISATILLAELPSIADLTPKALGAFTDFSLQEHSSGTSVPRSGRISRTGCERLRRVRYMCALGAKRNNRALAGFVERMRRAGQPRRVILIAVAREPLVSAHAVILSQKPSDPSHGQPGCRPAGHAMTGPDPKQTLTVPASALLFCPKRMVERES